MKYTISEKLLKDRGYTFQKLYARNHKTYRKQVGNRTIWLWQKGKSISIDDWHQHTQTILDFYKANVDHPDFEIVQGTTNKVPRGYIKTHLNRNTGTIDIFPQKFYMECIINDEMEKFDEIYNDDYTIIPLYRNNMNLILEEISILTK